MLARLAFWLMLPVTAAQGLWLRRRATRLPGATGDRRGVSGYGEDFHLLAIGDSIIDGVGTGVIEKSLPVQFATALAEQRLPDVAASIRLQRPDGERLVVVEPGPGKPGGRVEVVRRGADDALVLLLADHRGEGNLAEVAHAGEVLGHLVRHLFELGEHRLPHNGRPDPV